MLKDKIICHARDKDGTDNSMSKLFWVWYCDNETNNLSDLFKHKSSHWYYLFENSSIEAC